MRTLPAGAIPLLVASLAHADTPIEIGVYGGGFISNYYHQFYQLDLYPGGPGQPDQREELQKLSPMGGVRFAYFFTPWLGAEAEVDVIASETKMTHGSAQIWGGRAQLMFQVPVADHVLPYIAIGDGFDHVSSDPSVLGNDTDWPVHLGAGVRVFVTQAIALRLDGRFLRAPSQQAPYTLNASLGEFMFGLSFRPGRAAPEPPPPRPPTDLDADGITDDVDRCPHEPEDKDGFEDSDGCPELDNDKDGIADAQDKCPNEPEAINGLDDDDGCPDHGNGLVVVSADRLETLEAIQFKKTVIQKSSFNLLAQIGAQLRAHREILRLRITVHVQPSKKPDADLGISEERAYAIREWLTKYGIDEKRLEPRGFGGSKPLVPPAQKGSQTINERVELIILERE